MAGQVPEVETRYGRIRGARLGSLCLFRGVPFAAPPRGALRFQPPRAPEPWAGVRDTVRVGAAAPQLRVPGFRSATLAASRTSEDCLNLNLWTPGLDGARRPVLVWIHGGGFVIGSGGTPLYDGRALALRGDVVVVTVNYRLGAIGFTDLASALGRNFEHCSNLGLRDQIAALEWVRDHVEAFGGDPGNVTVFGQSAGAMSIAALLAAPSARGLFHRAIAQSGAAHHVMSRDQALRTSHALLQELGGPAADPEVLGRIPVGRLLDAQHRTMNRLADMRDLMSFAPSVDGDLLPRDPLEAVADGSARAVPLLVGTTLEEWKLFQLIDRSLLMVTESGLVDRVRHILSGHGNAPAPAQAIDAYRSAVRDRGGRTGARELWSAFQSARIFHHPATVLAERQASAGGPAYAYLFTWRSPTLRRRFGACHALELPFVWGVTRHPLARGIVAFDGSAHALAEQMQDAWLAFARRGDPFAEAGLPAWPCYDGERATMILGRRTYLDCAPLEAERRLWEAWTA